MPTMTDTLDINVIIKPDGLACDIASKWQEWDSLRSGWKEERKELSRFLYATDTSSTSVGNVTDWSNRTTLPKLTQIYDNLKANYTAALFPKRKWFKFMASDDEGLKETKSSVVEEYVLSKLEQDNYRITFDKLVDDFILYGNCFATVEWVEDYVKLNEGTDLEKTTPKFVGPKVIRISPYDIVFNPTSSSFSNSPKIVRSIVSLGSLHKLGYDLETISKLDNSRRLVGSASNVDKADQYIADGFSDIHTYYASGFVEILTFYGDIYDVHAGEMKSRRKITVLDRAYVVEDEEFPSWLGEDAIYHAGWRTRPDNLYAMGPLDNLVGMQYRMDHLENLKADVFDQVALPMLKVRGEVEAFEYEPGGKILIPDPSGDVDFLQPQASALQADNQIAYLQNQMEEFAGAPRQAMGIRTPGEKTAFEFGQLQESASRIFEHKAFKYEMEFVWGILNAMLESSRRNMNTSDLIRVFNSETKMALFEEVTRDDILTPGTLKPVGSSHFAESARRIANVNNLMQIKLSDPTVGTHLSGKKIAQILSDELGEVDLYEENIGIKETQEIQEAAQDAEADSMEKLADKQQLGI